MPLLKWLSSAYMRSGYKSTSCKGLFTHAIEIIFPREKGPRHRAQRIQLLHWQRAHQADHYPGPVKWIRRRGTLRRLSLVARLPSIPPSLPPTCRCCRNPGSRSRPWPARAWVGGLTCRAPDGRRRSPGSAERPRESADRSGANGKLSRELVWDTDRFAVPRKRMRFASPNPVAPRVSGRLLPSKWRPRQEFDGNGDGNTPELRPTLTNPIEKTPVHNQPQ